MKIVLSVDKNRIAPVFDVAMDFICFETDGEKAPQPYKLLISRSSGQEIIFKLAEVGTEVLICGAISRPLQLLAENNGIIVHGFLTGTIKEIITSFNPAANDHLAGFSMPGCSGQMRHRQRKRNFCRSRSS